MLALLRQIRIFVDWNLKWGVPSFRFLQRWVFRFLVESVSSRNRTYAHWDSVPRKIPTTTLVRRPAFVFSEVPEGRHIVAHRETVGTRDAVEKSPGGAAQLLGQVCRPSGAFRDVTGVPTTFVVGYDMPSLRDLPIYKKAIPGSDRQTPCLVPQPCAFCKHKGFDCRLSRNFRWNEPTRNHNKVMEPGEPKQKN